MGVKIITDSGCDLPEEILKDYAIDVLPIVVIKDGVEYLDKLDISPLDVYEGMKRGEVYKTAQVPARLFEEKFKEVAESQEESLYIAFSSGLSGTYQTARLVKSSIEEDYPDLDLEIVDSRAASLGQGMIVLKAAEMAREGRTREDIIAMVEFYGRHLEHIITVDNIDYLYRGGRVTRTEAFVGGLLNIKPIIDINEAGELKPIDKVRGSKKAIKKLLDIMEERSRTSDIESQLVGILHTDDWELVDKMKEKIGERFGVENFIATNIGPAIGAHTGPGMSAVFFLNKSYN